MNEAFNCFNNIILLKQNYKRNITKNNKNKDLVFAILEVFNLFAVIFIKRILPNYKRIIYPLIYYTLTKDNIINLNESRLKNNCNKLQEYYRYEIGVVQPFAYILKEICSEISNIKYQEIEGKFIYLLS